MRAEDESGKPFDDLNDLKNKSFPLSLLSGIFLKKKFGKQNTSLIFVLYYYNSTLKQ